VKRREDAVLTIALSRGKLFDRSVELLLDAGVELSREDFYSRKLDLRSRDGRYRVLLVKPWDIPIYVEYGIADVGIVGADVLWESEADVYEPLDLGFGQCQIVVAGRQEDLGRNDAVLSQLRVATKYPNLTRRHFGSKGVQAEIIRLAGSVELSVLAGLADKIVDLVETGETLRQNALVIHEVIGTSTARLIVNKASHALKMKQMAAFTSTLRERIHHGNHSIHREGG